jgi:hypothetical protein
MKKSGMLFHAKHAYMPNNLGYCGPDENGTILDHLEEGKEGDRLVKALQGFEAAYPFLRLIARNSGREAFDYSVPEAYWIGNDLLEMVAPDDFLRFSKNELSGSGMKNLQPNFMALDGAALPHHSFYVMGTYIGRAGDGPTLDNESAKKVAQLMDDCRISWGTVRKIDRKELVVRYEPLVIEESGLALGVPKEKRVRFDASVKPFGTVKPGDVVSIHWNYACDLLSQRQARNITKYTAKDIALANRLLAGAASLK